MCYSIISDKGLIFKRNNVFIGDLCKLMLSTFTAKFVDGGYQKANTLKKLETRNC